MATGKDRAKASRIRARIDAGTASDEQVAWLQAFKESPARGLETEDAATSRARVESGFVPVDFGPDKAPPKPAQATPIDAAPKCTIPNCSACKGVTGGAICLATGQRVWPPMSKDVARGYARGVFVLIGLIIRWYKGAAAVIPPLDTEVELLAQGIVEFQTNRASWLGAFNDVGMIAGGLVNYSRRAARASEKATPAAPALPTPAATERVRAV